MKISVRPRYTSCPHCQDKYTKLPNGDLFCPSCDFKGPSSYFLDFYHGGRHQIFSDERGMVLDSKSRVVHLIEQIQYEITKGIFDPDKYKRAELKKYWTDHLMDLFWRSKLPSIAPSYIPNYRRIVNIAKEFFKNKDVRDIRRIHLVEYIDYLRNKPVGKKTIFNYLSIFRTFMTWSMNDLGIIPSIPNFPKIEKQESQINWISSEEQVKLLNLAKEKDKPILMFLMLSGIRPGEARALKVGDVDLDRQNIHVYATFSGEVYRTARKGRGAKGYYIPIHPEMIPYITERVKSSTPAAWLFPANSKGKAYSSSNLQYLWMGIIRKSGITYRLRLYDATRHSVVSGLLSKGESIYTVSKLVGHSNIKTTMNYAHADLDSMRRSISKITLLEVKHGRKEESCEDGEEEAVQAK